MSFYLSLCFTEDNNQFDYAVAHFNHGSSSPLIMPLLALVIAFFSGSLPTALIMGKMKGIDLRTVGSGNIGATNAFRVLGKSWGITCLIIDAFKGWAPAVWCSRGAFAVDPATLAPSTWMLIVGLAAVAGHTLSPWLKFKGGKGVATSLGIFLAVAPAPVLICLIIGIALIAFTGYVSLASITGSALLPILVFAFSPAESRPWPVIALSVVLGVFVIYKHRENINRLMSGTENKIIGAKKPDGGSKTNG